MGKWFGRKSKQTTFCYCPLCHNELAGSNSFVSDTEQGVLYRCSRCGCESLWWFDDIAPWIIRHQKLTNKMWATEHIKTAPPKPLKKGSK